MEQFDRPVVRAGVIRQFEFTIELAWKTLKEYLINQGYQDITSPRSVFKKAYSEKLINDEDIWINMLRARNMTSHIYDEDISIEICNDIKSKYIPVLESLLGTMYTLVNE